MKNWVTIHTVELQMDAYFIRSRLEMELNIEVLLLDDLSIQAAPFASNIMGGVRIQVREDQVETARDFLTKNEYIKLEEYRPNKALFGLANFTQKIPVLNKLRVESRIFIFVTVLLVIIIVPIVLISQPIQTTEEDLIERNWCITKITRNGKEVEMNKNTPYVYLAGCEESLSFPGDSRLNCPQYDEHFHWLKWRLQGETLIIENIQEMNNSIPEAILIGEYEIDMSNTNLILSSKSIRIESKRLTY